MEREDAVSRLIGAIDTTDIERAAALAGRLDGSVGALKLGLEFFHRHGPGGVRRLTAGRRRLFLDLKMHDIPATVAGGVRAIAPLEPFMTTVHAAGGAAMLRAAMAAARDAAVGERMKVLAVTVLTSIDEEDLPALGTAGPVEDQVLRLADLALEAGTDGVVCSARELGALRRRCGAGFLLVVPGIRPARSERHDQKRAATPAQAISDGADYLVVGRAIARAADPAGAAARIADEMAA